MVLSTIVFLICLTALFTFWQPRGLTSAVVTTVSCALIIIVASFSKHLWAQVLAHVGWVLIALVGGLGIFTLLLILNAPHLVVRKQERLTYGLIAGVWLWVILAVGWVYGLNSGHFGTSFWPWLTFIPAFSTYLGILFAASLFGALRADWWRAKRADTLLILGAGLQHGDQIGRVLGSRLDTALALAQRQIKKPTIIVSGGQGPDETCPESTAMAAYLVAHGWDAKDIIEENQATNTLSNILYSQRLWSQLPDGGGKVVIVTSNYHLFRAEHLASELGLRIGGYPAHVRWSYLPGAWAREFLAIIMLHPRLHRGVLIGFLTANVLWLLLIS